MHLERYFMIYLWPKYKNVGWKMLHVDFVTGFTAIPKMLITISFVKPLVTEKVQAQPHNVYFVAAMSIS